MNIEVFVWLCFVFGFDVATCQLSRNQELSDKRAFVLLEIRTLRDNFDPKTAIDYLSSNIIDIITFPK